jgi:hypothetical protein
MPKQTGRRWRERQKVLDRDRQRRIDGERLRHVADGRVAAPVEDDSSLERQLPEQRPQQRALAGAVGPDDDVKRAARHPDRHAIEQQLAVLTDRQLPDVDERLLSAVVAHASVTSARIMVSTFRCISRSNLSAVYSPDAM